MPLLFTAVSMCSASNIGCASACNEISRQHTPWPEPAGADAWMEYQEGGGRSYCGIAYCNRIDKSKKHSLPSDCLRLSLRLEVSVSRPCNGNIGRTVGRASSSNGIQDAKRQPLETEILSRPANLGGGIRISSLLDFLYNQTHHLRVSQNVLASEWDSRFGACGLSIKVVVMTDIAPHASWTWRSSAARACQLSESQPSQHRSKRSETHAELS